MLSNAMMPHGFWQELWIIHSGVINRERKGERRGRERVRERGREREREGERLGLRKRDRE
jgi:hypothetical protein